MKFLEAFGAPLVNMEAEIGPQPEIHVLWQRTVPLRGKQYALPDGNVVTRFINILAEEIELANNKRQPSERELIFPALMLQRDKMIRKAKDIRPLLSRRMDMWEAGQLSELVREAECCDQRLRSALSPMTQDRTAWQDCS